MCFNSSVDEEALKAAEWDEGRRQDKITRSVGKVNAAFGQFGENYLKKRRNDFFSANLPALMANFRAARDRATFAQARGGQIGPGGATSSAAIGQNRSLFAGLNANRQDLMSRAFDFSNMERDRLRQHRSNVISQLRGTYDPTATYNAQDIESAIPAGSDGTLPLFANLSGILADAIRPQKRVGA